MKKILYVTLILLSFQCRERYDIPFGPNNTSFLVVEGTISYGSETNFRLSRTSALSALRQLPESDAVLQIEGEDNSVFSLSESDSGRYFSPTLPLNTATRYRLKIITKNSKEYISEFKPVINTPVIDSLTWIRQDGGVEIYVNANDPENDTRYYKWDYTETWEFHSAFKSNTRFFNSGQVTDGTQPIYVNYSKKEYKDSLYTCYKTVNSSSITIGTTTKLSQDIVYLPIIFYPRAAIELSVLYSVNVKQYGISKDAYQFYEKMKKNTESVGSVFDAQPSEIKGNIVCTTDPSEPVVGYVEVTSSHEKRIFISNEELPDWGHKYDCITTLGLDNIPKYFDSLTRLWIFPVLDVYRDGLLPTLPEKTDAFGNILTYSAAPIACVDCRLKGTHTKPSFWPQ